MAKKEFVVIDYRKPKKYGGKEWQELKHKQEKYKKRIKSWTPALGGTYEVHRKRLYYNKKKVYKWKGWGLGAGTTYYQVGKGRDKESIGINSRFPKYLKKYLKPHTIPIIKKKR
jgi:hypothetical protein